MLTVEKIWGERGDIMILVHGGIRRCRDTEIRDAWMQGYRDAEVQGSGM